MSNIARFGVSAFANGLSWGVTMMPPYGVLLETTCVMLSLFGSLFLWATWCLVWRESVR